MLVWRGMDGCGIVVAAHVDGRIGWKRNGEIWGKRSRAKYSIGSWYMWEEKCETHLCYLVVHVMLKESVVMNVVLLAPMKGDMRRPCIYLHGSTRLG